MGNWLIGYENRGTGRFEACGVRRSLIRWFSKYDCRANCPVVSVFPAPGSRSYALYTCFFRPFTPPQALRVSTTGLANKEITTRLGVSYQAIDARRAKAMRKLRADSVAELVRVVVEAERLLSKNRPIRYE